MSSQPAATTATLEHTASIRLTAAGPTPATSDDSQHANTAGDRASDPQPLAAPETSQPFPSATTEGIAEPTPRRRGPIREVSPRSLTEFTHSRELVYAIFCGVNAHKQIYERANGELHGDINPNALILFDHPEPDGKTRTEGGLIYWEPPISLQTLRKLGNPDRAFPPPAQPQYTMPPPYFRYY